ncbi:hypothetical protein HPP92_003977 [Vanilla planifolia]|uniref:Protein EARLY HEADING DATE 2 n=1 Tax=Vanilla planifolia TaxID=51239 RepID=A0A835VJY0_VANPL|nr:hypothetical protein HPP92_003977 [Vanilla planifolia]
MKGFVVDENMSNLTTAVSGDPSVSSKQPPSKKKRNLPGNPDPEAEVIALSPRTLMATNRFVCEICNKGFQRDQNLQLHRRGHNLPWKLKQRSGKEVRKKVYVCPEVTCVHHEPARALGDLTGIKKHFSRKHGEKKWKCDKCSKKYAVQSDWKAHSKICGTREYRCDCGTLFSRRDSFITHRAFCDVLTEEGAREMTAHSLPTHHSLIFPQPPLAALDVTPLPFHAPFPHSLMTSVVTSFTSSSSNNNSNSLQELVPKREDQSPLDARADVPAWLTDKGPLDLPSSLFQPYGQESHQTLPPSPPSVVPPPAHMSATALLQKAAQLGAKVSRAPPPPSQMAGHDNTNASTHGSAAFGIHQEMGFPSGPLFQTRRPLSQAHGFELGALGGENHSNVGGGAHGRGEEGGNNGLTRDFLGLRTFSPRDILSMAGMETCMSVSSPFEQQCKKPW